MSLKSHISPIEERDEILFGVRKDTHPFGVFGDNEEPQGFEIDLAKKIAKVLLGSEDKARFISVTAANRIMMLNSGQVDMLAATMSITPEREKILMFSTPYHTAGQAIMVMNNRGESNLADFIGKSMLVVYGSTTEKNLKANLPEVTLIGRKTYPEAFWALSEGRAVGLMGDDTVLMGYAAEHPEVRLLKKRYSSEYYAVALRNEKESIRLVDKVNTVIKKLEESGELSKMKSKWGLKR